MPILWAFVICVVFLMSGCVTTLDPTQANIRTTYVGIVNVESGSGSSSYAAPALSMSTTTIGARIQNGFGFGVFHETQIHVPMDCRLVLLVRTDWQLQVAIDLLSTMREPPCVTVDHSL